MSTRPPRSSRQRYRRFVDDYLHHRLDDRVDADQSMKIPEAVDAPDDDAGEKSTLWRRLRPRGKRREYLRDYLRWLRPLRVALGIVFLLALVRAVLEMIEPLFMRYIVDKVLLDATLTTAQRLTRLHMAGALILTVIIVSGGSVIAVVLSVAQDLHPLH